MDIQPENIIQLIVVVVLIVLSAFFSSAETSLTTVNKVRLKSLEEQGNKRAKRVLQILENHGKMLSTILIGNNIVNIFASSLVTTFAIDVFGSVAVGIASGILLLSFSSLVKSHLKHGL